RPEDGMTMIVRKRDRLGDAWGNFGVCRENLRDQRDLVYYSVHRGYVIAFDDSNGIRCPEQPVRSNDPADSPAFPDNLARLPRLYEDVGPDLSSGPQSDSCRRCFIKRFA